MGNKTVILGILIVYMLLNMIAGIWISRSQARASKKGFLNEYFAGGRSMGGVVLAMTLVATYTSASSFLGGPGLASSWGLTQVWVAAVQIGAAFLTLGVVGKKFAIVSRRVNAVSVSDYLRARYKSSAIVILSSTALVVFFITQMVAQFIGGATLLQSMTGLPYKVGLLIFAAVVIIYTAVGGFRAVVITDTIQGFIMMLGTFLMIFFIAKAGGGMGTLIEETTNTVSGWNILGLGEAGEGIAALKPGYLISYWVLVGIAVMGLPQTSVRSMGFKDTSSMHRAMIYGTITVGILMIGMHFAGSITAPLLGDAEITSTDQVIPYVVLNYMPSWAAGLFLAAPAAAIMSTVDSLLILASATLIKDVYVHYIRKDKADTDDGSGAEEGGKNISKYSLAITAILGIVVTLFAINPPDIIVWINLFAMGGLEATFFWPLIGGLYWKKGTSTGCMASILTSLAVFIFFNQVKIAPFGVHEIVLGLIAGGIVYFAVSAATFKHKDGTLEYEQMLQKCF